MQSTPLNPSFDLSEADCAPSAIDTADKTTTELELIYWKTAYKRLAHHLDQLQAAYGRVLLGECRTADECAQFEADVAFLTDAFIRAKPCDSSGV